MKFLLNYIKITCVSSTETYGADTNVRDSTINTFQLFEQNHKAVVDSIEQKNLLIKNVYLSKTESPLNAGQPQPSSLATVRFSIFSMKCDSEIGNGLEIIRESKNKEELESNIEEFFGNSKNLGVIKMIFEASVDFDNSGTSNESKIIFPKEKMLFSLKVTPELSQEDFFNLNISFYCDAYDNGKFAEAFKTDDNLFGVLMVRKEGAKVFTSPLILLDTVDNRDDLKKMINKMLNRIKGNLERIGKIINEETLNRNWNNHVGILKEDLPNLQNNLNLILDWIDENEKLEAVEEITTTISKIQDNFVKERDNCISKLTSHIKETNLMLNDYLEQYKTLEENLKKNELDMNELKLKFEQLTQIYDKIYNEFSNFPFDLSEVNDDQLSIEFNDLKEKMITKVLNSFDNLKENYEKRIEGSEITELLRDCSDDIKFAFDDFIKKRDEINELIKNYGKSLKNSSREELLEIINELLSKQNDIESMSSFFQKNEKENTDKENSHKKIYKYTVEKFIELRSKFYSSSIFKSSTIKNMVMEKIVNLEEMMDQHESSKKEEKLNFLTTSANEIENEIKFYQEKFDEFLNALHMEEDIINSHKNFYEEMLEELNLKVEELKNPLIVKKLVAG